MLKTYNIPMESAKIKVAIVHDILDKYGGAERVVEALLQIWPDADLYVSRYTKHPETRHFEKNHVRTSFMQHLPFFKLLAKFYTPMYPFAFESFDLSSYDLVISSTAHFAKGVLTNPKQLHICYCHTPPRFLYGYPSESQTRNNILWRPIVALLDHWLRKYDYIIAQRPDYFLTNSHTTAERIKKFYHRPSTVIHPPIDREKFIASENKPGEYFLIVSRLLPYKNIDTVIKTFNRRTEKLLIVGDGPQREYLKQISTSNIEFAGFLSEAQLVQAYQKATALVFSASDEDFGISAIEAMAAGKPVIAYQSGGLTETVIEGKTGVLYKENTVESLNQAIDKFISIQDNFTAENLTDHANKYSMENFKNQVEDYIQGHR
jgi:glycosyltransferase involved in cell wall biosynthesis